MLTPWRTSAPETTTLGMFDVITACVLDQFVFVTNFAKKQSLQLQIGRGNYQQLKADKPCEHMCHRATQGLIFTQSETAEIRLTIQECTFTLLIEYMATVNSNMMTRYWPFVQGIHCAWESVYVRCHVECGTFSGDGLTKYIQSDANE